MNQSIDQSIVSSHGSGVVAVSVAVAEHLTSAGNSVTEGGADSGSVLGSDVVDVQLTVGIVVGRSVTSSTATSHTSQPIRCKLLMVRC